MAVKVAHDMKVFPVLANATSPVSVSELAALKPADPLLVGKFGTSNTHLAAMSCF